MLSSEQVRQFQILYEQRFGQPISQDAALEMGLKLIALVKLTCVDSFDAQQKRNERNQNAEQEKPDTIYSPQGL